MAIGNCQNPLGLLFSMAGTYLNNSSMVMTFCTRLEFSLAFSPYVATIVRCSEAFVFVSSAKVESLLRRALSTDASMQKSSSENFISHIFMTLSARSITMSICTPSFSLRLFHGLSSACTPLIPSACFICGR